MNHISKHQVNNAVFSLSQINPNSMVFRSDEYLFRMGDTLDGIYIVNSGVIKLFTLSESGDEHIIRFCMPGDLLGLDSLADGVSRSSAIVLDIANVTLIPLREVLSQPNDFDLSSFIHQIGKTFNQESEHSMMLSRSTARRRIAWFLVEFAESQANRGLHSTEFEIPMTRADLSLYLGLAVETVSRELTRLCKRGLINKCVRKIEILDLESLRIISETDGQVCLSKVCLPVAINALN